MKPLRIFLADDHDLIRAGARFLIEAEPGWEICGEAANGRDAVALIEKLKPDIAILDITMPELNGLEVTRQVKRLVPATEILILTTHETEELILDVFEAGARSYILKHDPSAQLVAAVQALAAHKTYFTSKISEVVFARFLQGRTGSGATEDTERGRLSPREREIVQLLCEGRSNKEVASQLAISVRTAETHRATVMHKLGYESFADLLRYAVRNKIVAA